MLLIHANQPLGKEPDYSQAACPCLPVRMAEGLLPLQEEFCADVFGIFLICKEDKFA
jgi:hypothetical protein